jgi:signal peptidase I
VVNKPEPEPTVVKPAAEFLEKPEPQERKAAPLFQPVPSRNAGDEQYFDELFDEKPKPKLEQNEPELFQETDFPETSFEPFFGETIPTGMPAIVAEPLVERKEPKRQSSLPGESADDFLFGPAERDDATYSRSRVDDSLFDDDEVEDEDEPPRRRKKSGGSGSGLAKTASVAGNVLFVALLLFMATLSFFLIQSRISGGVPKVAGYQMYIVLSGSMSPEFDTGSIAFVKETLPEQLVVGDIITFRSQSGSDSLTTHRIVEVNREEGLRFVTRGDANNVNDPNPVLAENVVGRVTGSIPYVGYVMSFVQTRQGLILLIFVPGVLIILFELGKIMKYLSQDAGGSRKSKKRKEYPRLAED